MRTLGSLLLVAIAAIVGGCGGGDTNTSQDAGVRGVSADDAFEVLFESPPEGLIVLDVRTDEEFADQRLADATLIDFYSPDFAQQIADLDRDAPYLMYCRSGNRSGQTAELMEELGFTDVQDVEGGIVSWTDAGHPSVTGNAG